MTEPSDEATLPTIDADASSDPAEPASPAASVSPSVAAAVTGSEAAGMHLSFAQQKAIAVLTAGRTRSEAALAAGVCRTTLYNWLDKDAAFQAAFNTWQNDVRTIAQAQLLAATHDAVAVVVSAIRRGDTALAWKLLQAQNMTIPRVIGSTDAGQIAADRDVEKRKRQQAQRRQKHDMDMQDMMSGPG